MNMLRSDAPHGRKQRRGAGEQVKPAGKAVRAAAAAAAVACLFVGVAVTEASSPRLVIDNVHVITMDDDLVLAGHAVSIEDGRIIAVEPSATREPVDGEYLVDGGGGYLVPGLVDTHVHVEEYLDARPLFGDAPVFLRHGITSVFNLRGLPEHAELRERIVSGELLAPMLYSSGEFVNEPRVTRPEEVVAEVRAQAQAGYEMLKFREVVDHDVGVLTTRGVDLETFRAMHAAAREIGMPVLGHAPHGLGLAAVLETGHTLAHAGELVQLHFFPRNPQVLQAFLVALAVLALVALFALAAGLLGKRRAWPLFRVAAGAGALAFAGLVLALTLIPGGFRYGSPAVLALMTAMFAAVLLLAAYSFRLILRENAWPARAGLAIAGLAALGAGLLGLSQGVPIALRGFPAEVEQVAGQLAASGARLGTTLIIYEEFGALRRGEPGRLGDDAVAALAPELRERYQRARQWFSRAPEWRDWLSIEQFIPRYDQFARELVGELHRAGVPLLAGTDAYGFILVPPGRSMTAELEILVEAGLSPWDALHSATVEPARFLRREAEFGRIAPGLRADLVLLQDNPLEDIRALREPVGVVLRGHWLSRAALERSLAEL
jgi:hypothetical protein